MQFSSQIAAMRMQRQYLIKPTSEKEFEPLFRAMSPVQTAYWCRPGDPPTIVHRTDFNVYNYCYQARSDRKIVKGRFQGGGVAYVFADEIELFAAVYKKDNKNLSFAEEEILDLLRSEGPLSIQMMKEITGILVKNLAPVLHKLQEKFLVFEDQTDNEWDRAWYLFETEFPDVNLKKYNREEALKTIILRFAYLNVLINIEMVRSFFRLTVKEMKTAVSELVAENKLLPFEEGYILTEDLEKIKENNLNPPKSVFALQRNDFLVKSNEYILREKYKYDEYDIRLYLLIDGEFKGAVYGFFKFSDVPIEDIIVDLSEEEANNRKEEILSAVGKTINFTACPLRRYNKKLL